MSKFFDEIFSEYDSSLHSTWLIIFIVVNSYAFKVLCERLKFYVFELFGVYFCFCLFSFMNLAKYKYL